MKKNNTKNIILKNLYLLIPFFIYSIYKNGFLLYQKDLISFLEIFKSIYLLLIAIIIKFLIDYIRFKEIKVDYNLISLILLSMIVPYNINVILYLIIVPIIYLVSLFVDKYIKINKVCFMYLILILINFIITDFTFKTPLEINYSFKFDFLDLLVGRNIGGISSTSILFSLSSYIILVGDYYYKKDIPLVINGVYLFLAIIYFIFTSNSIYLLNSELIFGSIFISTLPIYSPYKVKNQYLYGILIGILSFIITITFNSTISIYVSTFIISLLMNINIRQMLSNKTIVKVK